MHLLVAEDDPLLADALTRFLAAEGHACVHARDGREAAHWLARGHGFDAVLLDLGLPAQDGLAVLRALRARGDRVPVLVLTARTELSQRVEGLDAGADDYLTKPFDLPEVAARLRALARRAAGRPQNRIAVGGLELDPAGHRAWLDGGALALTAREFALLAALAERAGRWVPRESLVRAVWGLEAAPESNAVEVHVSKLRRKLGPGLLHSERGHGWQLEDRRA